MCGIAGSINFDLTNHKSVLVEGLKHRGPDNQTLKKVHENVWLFHARLAIQDLSDDSNQPFEGNHSTIILNGEIYNHKELKEKYGIHNTRTTSDTETLVLLLEKYGMSILEEMDGMFIIAWMDRRDNKFYIARDRAGKKPLYYSLENNSFVFASELRTLAAVLKPEIDDSQISKFIYTGFFYNSQTPYKNVQELELGSYLEIDTSGDIKPKKHAWWDITKFYREPKINDLNEALEQVDNALVQSVRNRLDSSDLEVGAFLSGGIDSGLITSVASEISKDLRTFTVRLPGAFDESGLAEMVANKLGTNHTVLDIDLDNLRDDIDQILLNYGEPFADSSAIPSYYVSKAAKDHVTVILNGDGADELFAGYRRYIPFKKLGGALNSELLRLLASGFKGVMPVPHNKKSLYNYIYRLADLSSKKGYSRYISATNDFFTGFEKFFPLGLDTNEETELWKSLNKEFNNFEALIQMDFKALLFGDLLVKMDIATMASSLEGRSPFMSKYFLELAPRLNDDLKVNGNSTKFILRTLAKKYLPVDLLDQPKRGFEVPLKKWMMEDLNDLVQDRVGASGALVKDYVDNKFLSKLVNREIRISDERWAKMMYSLFVTETWLLNQKR